MNIDIITLVVFIILLSLFLYINRKKLVIQKALFPILYVILYRTNIGIKLMDRVAKKYRELIKFIGLCCIGIAFVGLAFISYNMLSVIIKFLSAPKVAQTGVALVLPGMSVPGIGYLSFWHWIISIFILAIIHEFSHGVMARAHNLEVESSGFAIVGIILPILPAAFVEPSEKKLVKRSDVEQYSIFAAGPISNIILALLLFLVFAYVFMPAEARMNEPIGFSFTLINDSLPAAQSGLVNHTIITTVNGERVNNSEVLLDKLNYCTKPGETIYLGNDTVSYAVVTVQNPGDAEKPFIGITNIKDEYKVKEKNKNIAPVFNWFKDLVYWLFLLNFFIGLINLLPIFITDGARMLQIALSKVIHKKENALKIWKLVNILFLLLIFIGLLGNYLKGFFF